MEVEGRLVIVDAPCSGVQMAWMAYFTACATALIAGLGDGRFARRLPGIGLVVLAGNVVRNTVLVCAEARGVATSALHEGVGLAVLGRCARPWHCSSLEEAAMVAHERTPALVKLVYMGVCSSSARWRRSPSSHQPMARTPAANRPLSGTAGRFAS